MKRRILIFTAFLLGACATLSAQTPQELFNQALVQERGAGNLDEAVQLFQRVARESTDNRVLAVQALMGAARSYQKLGQTAQSKNLYEEVIRSYSDQKEQAALARQYMADTGVLQGTVLRVGTGEPIPNAKVRLGDGPIDAAAFAELQTFMKGRGVDISPPASGVINDKWVQSVSDIAAARNVSLANPGVQAAIAKFQEANDSRFSATADSTGRFTIRGVLPGEYSIQTNSEGYFAPDDSSVSREVIVSAGKTTTVEVPLIRGAVISGRITDAAGQPQAGVTVAAYAVRYQEGFPALDPVMGRLTNAQGEYRLSWLRSGEYLVAVAPGIKVDESGNARRVALTPGADGLTPAAKTFYPGTADVATAIPVFVRGEQPISGIDIQAKRLSTFHIKGTIRSHVPRNTTYVIANFALRYRNTNLPDDGAIADGTVNVPKVGDQYVGEFDLSGVAPGSYNLRVWTREQNPDGGSNLAFASADVDVANQDVTGLVLDISMNVRVSGTVTIDGVAPGQVPARVFLQVDGPFAKSGVYQGLSARPAVANSQTGAFMIGAVPAGKFRAYMGPGLPPELYLADVRQNGVSVFDSGFDVGKESPAPVQLVLRSGARTVEGTIRDAKGKAVPGATTVLVPPRERRLNRALYFTAKADANGRFKIEGVAPGSYSLFSWQKMPEGAYFNERFVSRNEEAGRRINVTQSSAISADITLINK